MDIAVRKKRLLVSGFCRIRKSNNKFIEIPSDVFELLMTWILMKDWFDKEFAGQHKNILLQSEGSKISKDCSSSIYCSAFGTIIVEKGHVQHWKFQIDKHSETVIGIIDAEIAKERGGNSAVGIEDFSDAMHNGYGLGVGTAGPYYGMPVSCDKYHGNEMYVSEDFIYPRQFKWDRSKDIIVSMTLDLSQQKSKCGLLSCKICNCEPKDATMPISETGKYSNIAFNDIDIDKKYILAIALWYDKESVTILD